jgi:hypothetical protein
MIERVYQLIALVAAAAVLARIDGDPGALGLAVALAAGALLCVFVVASIAHIYWGRRG